MLPHLLEMAHLAAPVFLEINKVHQQSLSEELADGIYAFIASDAASCEWFLNMLLANEFHHVRPLEYSTATVDFARYLVQLPHSD